MPRPRASGSTARRSTRHALLGKQQRTAPITSSSWRTRYTSYPPVNHAATSAGADASCVTRRASSRRSQPCQARRYSSASASASAGWAGSTLGVARKNLMRTVSVSPAWT